MGIRGLKQLLKKNVPEAFTDVSLSCLKGSVLAIDSSILLYKYRYLYQSDNFHLIGFTEHIHKMNELGIQCVYIFDGQPPEAKQRVLKERVTEKIKMAEKVKELKSTIPDDIDPESLIDSGDETDIQRIKKVCSQIKKLQKNILYVNRKHSLEVMEMLQTLGIPYSQSEGEAEELCAFLQKTGSVDYVLTEDTDSLTFGATKVLFSGTSTDTLILCNLETVLLGLGITQSQFIDLCILCGCDYLPSIPKLGCVTALKLIQQHKSIPVFIENNTKYSIPESFDYNLARNLFGFTNLI
jgi:flap endonuclease-1